MSVGKISNRKKPWYFSVRYTDDEGNTKQKKKEGFATRREALEAERAFISEQENKQSYKRTFRDDVKEYMDYCKSNKKLKASTLETKHNMIEKHIQPYFGDMLTANITKVDVLSWQRSLIQDEEEYSKTFLHSVHSQLSAIFNYLCKYKDLPRNPASECGAMGQKKVDEMEFWTVDEFNTFIPVVDDVMFRTIFYVLFFSGMRVGELLALTKDDIDFAGNTISISKTFNRVGGKDIITSPKTRKSKRVIDMHPTIMKILQDYVDALYELRDNDRLFATTKSGIAKRKAAYCKQSGVKQIRTHDLRHSHVAMLINLGVRIEVISARLGHEKVSTTWDIYGHLYPNSQQEAVAKMDSCIKI